MKADLFETDFSKATVITMFLLPDINLKLRPKILDLKPGTRIVSNSFTMDDWEADETRNDQRRLHELVHGAALDRAGQGRRHVDDAAGRADARRRRFRRSSGTLGTAKIEGKMSGDQITFTAGKTTYTGKVNGTTIQGTAPGAWTATKR